MRNKFDRVVDFCVEKIMFPISMVMLAGVVIVMLIAGIYFAWEWIMQEVSPVPPEEITINFRPYWWSCTGVSWEEYNGGNMKTGYYKYHECHCIKWDAHLVGKPHKDDEKCPDGSGPFELKGVR